MSDVAVLVVIATCLLLAGSWAWSAPATLPAADVPAVVSDYDGGNIYWVVDGHKYPQHGTLEPWVFNRAMTWLGAADGIKGAVLCYSIRSPLLLSGQEGVSRWYAGTGASVTSVDEQTTRFERKGGAAMWDHAHLPPVQYAIEQSPTARFEVTKATCPWQFIVAIKGRSGPVLYASAWQEGRATLNVDLLKLYRDKGYTGNFAEFEFALATRSREDATVDFRLRLEGREAVIPSLPVIRTLASLRGGVPVHAIVVDASATRQRAAAVAVTVELAGRRVVMTDTGNGLWTASLPEVGAGDHRAAIKASWKDGSGRSAEAHLDIHVNDGQFVGYDPKLRLLTLAGKPLGPLTGSYRGAPMFQHIGTDRESLVQGQAQWDLVKGTVHEGQHGNHGGPNYGFHFWESLTPSEIDRDYAYLEQCGWTLTHLCQGWWAWERFDAAGHLAPHGAEQLSLVLAAARRHGIKVNVALTHYPLGRQSKPYAQYLEAGYKPSDYSDTNTRFYQMLTGYLTDFAGVFAEDSAISSYTAAGEGDVDCGKVFVNAVHDLMERAAPYQLFLCEPHLNPKPYPADINYYRRDGWKPVLGGMRTYMIDNMPAEHIAVQYKLGAMGDVFLGEGVFWGFANAARDTQHYRERIRREFYTGLVYRSPIMLSWEERVVEDERQVFEQVRRAIDWSTRFQRPRLAVRIGPDVGTLVDYERALAKIPLEYRILARDEQAPADVIWVLGAAERADKLAFKQDGGVLPEELRTDMPVGLPAGYTANYSWSEDRQILLAFVCAAGDERATTNRGEAVDLRLHNLPRKELPYTVYDLATRKVAASGAVREEAIVKLPRGVQHILVVVGGGAVLSRK